DDHGGWRERRTRRRVEGLNDHYIVCGYGRMGAGVARALRTTGVDARPGPETRLEVGDVVIGVGTGDEVRALEALFETTEAVAR
ncbi:MAG: hypothetical protein M3123_00270, partial [Actinomycetota bacterium]|nr:hypothetical protein [Actinomycetota bacterium]